MNVKDKLNQIKTLLGLEVKFEQAKLADGTTVEAEQFAPEYSVGVATDEGIVPMPVGEYEMENGQVLVVAQEGIIAEIKEMAPEQEPEAPVEAEKEEVQAKRIVESVSKETFFEAVEKLTKENEFLKAEIASLKSAKVEMSADPEPINFNPENKQQQPIAYVKSKSLKSEIYKNLFN